MQALLDGTICNTKTAMPLAQRDNGVFINDDDYYRETLYRNEYGKYFLHIYGGPSSLAANHGAQGNTVGERLIPLTLQEARNWTKTTMGAQACDALFGEYAKDFGDSIFMSFYLTPRATDILEKNIQMRGRTGSEVITTLLEHYA